MRLVQKGKLGLISKMFRMISKGINFARKSKGIPITKDGKVVLPEDFFIKLKNGEFKLEYPPKKTKLPDYSLSEKMKDYNILEQIKKDAPRRIQGMSPNEKHSKLHDFFKNLELDENGNVIPYTISDLEKQNALSQIPQTKSDVINFFDSPEYQKHMERARRILGMKVDRFINEPANNIQNVPIALGKSNVGSASFHPVFGYIKVNPKSKTLSEDLWHEIFHASEGTANIDNLLTEGAQTNPYQSMIYQYNDMFPVTLSKEGQDAVDFLRLSMDDGGVPYYLQSAELRERAAKTLDYLQKNNIKFEDLKQMENLPSDVNGFVHYYEPKSAKNYLDNFISWGFPLSIMGSSLINTNSKK